VARDRPDEHACILFLIEGGGLFRNDPRMDGIPQTSAAQDIATEEIPLERWASFARDLSSQHLGWHVWIEALGRETGDQPVLDGMPLQGMSYEREGSAAGSLLIEAGDRPDLFIHQVSGPRCLRVAHVSPGALLFIQLESSDGSVTLVRLQRMLSLPAGKPSADRKPTRRTLRGRSMLSARGAAALLMAGVGLWLLLRTGSRR
jgi:hypothetical protein